MGTATRQQEVLEELRRQIRRIERRPARREGVLACGRPEVEALLPGGGFPRGALSSLCGGPGQRQDRRGPRGAAGGAGRRRRWPPSSTGAGELYPPAALALGVNLARLLIVRPEPRRGPRAARVLARPLGRRGPARERGLRRRGVDVPLRGVPAARAEPMLRRLRAAAEKGGAAALLLSGPGDPAIPAALRIDLDGPAPAGLRAVGGGEDGHAA